MMQEVLVLKRCWRGRQQQQVVAFIDGVTAAAVGAIAGAVIILAKRQFIDITSIAIAIITVLILLRLKVPEPLIIIAAAIVGLLISK